jgi:hypothetical protein
MTTTCTVVTAAMVAGCGLTGCGQKPPPAPLAPILDVTHHVAPGPLGIPRSGVFPCDGETIESEVFEVCFLQWHTVRSIDKQPDGYPDKRETIQPSWNDHPPLPPTDCTKALRACGRLVGGDNASQVVACRGADGELDGPLEVIAVDGTVLENGYCESGRVVAWARWKAGRLHEVFGREFLHGGPVFTPDGYEYLDGGERP